MAKTLLIAVAAVILLALTGVGIAAAMNGGGYTQEEVDALVADAVESAIADAQDDLVSEAEAQVQADEAAKQATLIAAVDECGLENSPYIIADEAGLSISGAGDLGPPGAPFDQIVCILDALDVPETIIDRMGNTNSLMGVVDYQAEWTYHPDNGFHVYVTAS